MTKDKQPDIVDRVESLFLALILLAMTGVTFIQVVLRYAFNSGLQWALELTIYLFATLVLLGAGHLMKRNEHLGVAAFVQLFPQGIRKAMGLGAALACIIYAGFLIWGSWFYVQRMFQIGIETHDLHLPKWVPLSVLPIGLGIFALRSLQAGWQVVTGVRETVIADGEVEVQHLDSGEAR